MKITERLKKVTILTVRPVFSSLSVSEKEALAHCIQASHILTDIYLEQVYDGNHKIYERLQDRNDREGKNLLRYFRIHGCPWDGYAHNEPFIPGIGTKPKFGTFYPSNFSKAEWDGWLNAHPEDREQFESNYTVIRRKNGGLVAVPYSVEYAGPLSKAAKHLRLAAMCLPTGALRTFLELRADAFISNDYFASDMAWVDTDGYPFEVTIGPYETYIDELLGLKASFESFIALPDAEATLALARFAPVVPDFDVILSKEFHFKAKGAAIPLEVVADVIRGGDAAFGSQFVAFNLPNDRRVHDLKGSKKVFSRTMMEAKFVTLTLPIAERLLPPDDFAQCTFTNRLLFILAHELAHGLGPSMIHVDGREVPFEVPMGDLHSALEEAKADMLGARLLNYFRNRGLLDDETLRGIMAIEIVSYFQTWRHGFTGAHARGHLVEYNWLKDAGAIHFDNTSQTFDIDIEQCVTAMECLSTKLLHLQIAGDYAQAKLFMEHWGTVSSEVSSIIESLHDLPIAVNPVWNVSALK